MLKKGLISLLLTAINIIVFAQSNIGEIKVSDKYTVTLMFAEPIEFVIWGQNPVISVVDGMPVYQNYEQFQRDKTLTVNAKKFTICALPPWLTNGSGIPVTGSMPKLAQIFSIKGNISIEVRPTTKKEP